MPSNLKQGDRHMYYQGEGVPSGYGYPVPESRAGSSAPDTKEELRIPDAVLERLKEKADQAKQEELRREQDAHCGADVK